MLVIPLQQLAKQAFSIQLDNNFYEISIVLTVDVMSVTIIRNQTPIVMNTRAVPHFPIIPYQYLESGNFAFITVNDEYPNYLQFGINQFLIYFTQVELDNARAAV